jgi:ABC-type molybdate transport system permease subunit
LLFNKVSDYADACSWCNTGVVGAVVSVVPVAGNKVDAALEKVDKTIDKAADRVDDVP